MFSRQHSRFSYSGSSSSIAHTSRNPTQDSGALDVIAPPVLYTDTTSDADSVVAISSDYLFSDCGTGLPLYPLDNSLHHTGQELLQQAGSLATILSPSSGRSTHGSSSDQHKKYACEVCHYTTNKICNLKTHRRIHTGEKPFRCHICDKYFSLHKNLHSHFRVHREVDNAVCRHCNRVISFIQWLYKFKKIKLYNTLRIETHSTRCWLRIVSHDKISRRWFWTKFVENWCLF